MIYEIYTKNKGLDDIFYRELIKKALKQHVQLGRTEIDELLLDKLPDILSEEQKTRKIGNLLTYLRKNGVIYLGKNKKWNLREL